MYSLFDRTLRHIVKTGALHVTDPLGLLHTYGDGSGEAVRMTIKTDAAARRIALDPDLHLGECYMDGSLVLDQGTPYDLMALLISNIVKVKSPLPLRLFNRLRILAKRLHQYNPVGKAKTNVAHHYDLSGRSTISSRPRPAIFLRLFRSPSASLEDAQSPRSAISPPSCNCSPA
jgi:cyclopropane-fatty-acyl-phospholipid synthase